MKLAGYSTCLLVTAISILAFVDAEDTKYDLSDKNQFTFYFRDQWQTMFNTPQPVANPAKDKIVSLLADDVYFQPCYTVARQSGNRFFKDRLWGMMLALKNCHVTSSVVLPADPNNNKDTAVLEMEFIQNATYNSYTRHFHDISMEMKARKAQVNDPYRIYRIIEICNER